jgi:hypothetical protein
LILGDYHVNYTDLIINRLSATQDVMPTSNYMNMNQCSSDKFDNDGHEQVAYIYDSTHKQTSIMRTINKIN